MAGINLPTLVQRLKLDTSGVRKGEREATTALDRVSNKADKAGKALTIGVTAPLVGLGAAGISAAAEVDKGLREVNTLFGLTGKAAEDSFAKLKGEVAGLSAELGVAQSELSNGLYQAISAGVPRENAATFLQVATKASIAGVTDLETSVDGITTTLNAFGLDASQAEAVADSMFATVKGGKTTFDELSSALFNVAPTAAAANVSFQEVNAALATLTAAGTPTSVATTQVRAALVGLQRPSEELDAIFQELGYTNAQTALEAEGLGFALEAVTSAADGDAGTLQKLLGSVEAVGAANVLAGTGAEKFAAEMENQANSAGAVDTAFNEMEQSTSRQLEKLKVQLQNLAITLGEALLPVVNKGVAFVSKLATAFGNLSAGQRKVVGVFLGIAAAAGPVLIIMAKLVQAMATLRRAFLFLKGTKAVAAGIKALGVAFRFVSSTLLAPPLGIVLAIGAVVAALVVLYKRNESFRRFVDKAWRAIRGAFVDAWEKGIRPALEALGRVIGSVVDAVGGAVAFVGRNWRTIATLFGGPIGIVIAHFDTLKSVVTTVFGAISSVVTTVWRSGIKPVLDAIGKVLGVVGAIFRGFGILVAAVWTDLSSAIVRLWSSVVRPVFQAIRAAVEGYLTVVFTVWRTVITTVWDAVSSVISSAWGIVRGVFDAMVGFVSGPLSSAFTTLRDTLSSVWGGIVGGATSAFDTLKSVIGSALSAVGTVVGGFASAVATVADKVGLDSVASALRSFAGAASSFGFAAGGVLPAYRQGGELVPLRDYATAPRRKVGRGFVASTPRAIVGEGSGSHPEYVVTTDPRHRKRSLDLYRRLGKQLGVDDELPAFRRGGVLVPRYGVGDVLGGIVDKGKGAAGGAVDLVQSGADKVRAVGGVVIDTAKGVASGLANLSPSEVVQAIREGGAALVAEMIPAITYDAARIASVVPASYMKVREGLISTIKGGADAQAAASGVGGLAATKGLNPEFLRRFRAYAGEVGGLRIVSGYRSNAQQARLYQLYKAGKGNLAAAPGKSRHNQGLAIDHAPRSTPRMRKVAAKYRLHYPVRGEPWHVQPFAAGGVLGDVMDQLARSGLYDGPQGPQGPTTAQVDPRQLQQLLEALERARAISVTAQGGASGSGSQVEALERTMRKLGAVGLLG